MLAKTSPAKIHNKRPSGGVLAHAWITTLTWWFSVFWPKILLASWG